MINQGEKRYRGLVVFDVDGVIYRDFFLKRLAIHRGFFSFLKLVLLGLKYYRNKINIQELLERGYNLVKGISSDRAVEIAGKIKRVHNLKKTIKILKNNGFFVAIISAGIPSFILEYLADEIGADYFHGLDIDRYSRDLSKEKIWVISKRDVVGKLVKDLGLKWNNVVSIGDDPNNIELFKKSGISIGFNPTKSIRKEATVIIEGNNFLEILPYILREGELPKNLQKGYFIWKREIFRKLIHIIGIGVPFLAQYFSKPLTLAALSAFIVIYLISEILRHHGLSFFLLAKITKSAQRDIETRNIIFGPVFLGVGIFFTILFFPFRYNLPSTMVVSISDTLSSIVGKLTGRHHIPGVKNSSIEGSIAFFISAFAILAFFFPLGVSILVAAAATIMEIIPIYNLDNLIIPVGTALMLSVLT